MITSNQNPKVRRVRELLAKRSEREASGALVVEGVRLVEEAFSSGWPVELVLFSGQLSARGQRALDKLAGSPADIEEIAAHLMDGLTDTETSQGLLAVIRRGQLLLPAGGDFFGTVGVIFVILLITDILGFTQIFPVTRSQR